jgi:integrase/recombinase XerD
MRSALAVERGRNEMSKNRKPPAGTYWRNGVLWGRVRLTGKPAFQRSLDTDDPKIAARRIEAIKAELNGRVKHGEARYAFSEATAAWGVNLTDRVSANTASRYLCSLGQLASYLNDKFIDQINGTLIADIIRGRRANGVTIATVKRDLVALSSVMGFCIDEGWLEANPVLPRLGRLKERRDPIVLPEHDHIKIIVQRAPGRLADLIRAALLTGCRMDELVSAKRSQFDDNKRQLTVVGKRNKMRTIDLSDVAMEVLRRAALDKADWLFSHDGQKYRQVSSRWRNLCDGSAGHAGPDNDGIVPFPFHNLRHRYAVDYLKTPLPEGGTPSIYLLSQHLGHTSVKTTEIYLAYLSPTEKQAVMFGKTG